METVKRKDDELTCIKQRIGILTGPDKKAYGALRTNCDTPGKILGGGKGHAPPHVVSGRRVLSRRRGLSESFFEGHFSEHERVFVRFHGVDKICRVYLNGTLLGSHEGGYTRFAFELTNVQKHGKNILRRFCKNNEKRGRTVSPLSGDFPMFGASIPQGGTHHSARKSALTPGLPGTEGV